ncbi:hypothetical protein AB5I39_08525 [Sphingomonas sp. MMS24-J45]|uniref:hypothetical protein n=1 Tax=Sphingomonas sp. MMS24-J45 TaxID=3238806 RepID=UPI00384DC3B2
MSLARTLTSLVLAASLVAPLPAQAAPAKAELVVWTGPTCGGPDAGGNRFIGALVALVLPSLIQAGIKGLGDGLQSLGKRTDVHVVAAQPSYFYRATLDPSDFSKPAVFGTGAGCVLVALGPRASAPTMTAGEVAGELKDDAPLNGAGDGFGASIEDRLGAALDRDRMTVMVVRIEVAPDGTAFRLVPQLVRIGAAIDGKHSKKRTLALTISVFAPSVGPDGTSLATRSFGFEDETAPRTIGLVKARLLATSWMPMPSLSDPAKARLTAVQKRQDDLATATASGVNPTLTPAQRQKASKDVTNLKAALAEDLIFLARLTPVTWRADFHETSGGSGLLTAIGKFLSDKSEAIAKPIAAEFDPKTAQAALDEEDGLRIAAVTDVDAYVKAKAAGGAALRIAQIKAQASCRKLEVAGYADAACLELQ